MNGNAIHPMIMPRSKWSSPRPQVKAHTHRDRDGEREEGIFISFSCISITTFKAKKTSLDDTRRTYVDSAHRTGRQFNNVNDN